jgi:hypothetical protein
LLGDNVSTLVGKCIRFGLSIEAAQAKGLFSTDDRRKRMRENLANSRFITNRHEPAAAARFAAFGV